MDVQTTQPRSGRAAYDAAKRSLFADLRGTVLEIGAGSGANNERLTASYAARPPQG